MIKKRKRGRPKKIYEFTFLERLQINRLQMHFIKKIVEKEGIDNIQAQAVICNHLLSW